MRMSKMVASAKIGETLDPQVVALAKLGLSDEEIKQVLADDKRIDKGEKLFELSAEQEGEAKKARNVGRGPTAYKFTKRERKPDEDKKVLCQTMIEALIEADMIDNSTLHIENIEREFLFKHNGRKYKVVLSAPRS